MLSAAKQYAEILENYRMRWPVQAQGVSQLLQRFMSDDLRWTHYRRNSMLTEKKYLVLVYLQ